jgi:hypothetical protein
VPTDDEQGWRILLENILTGEKCGFTCLEDLLAFLHQVTMQTNEIFDEGSHTKVQD